MLTSACAAADYSAGWSERGVFGFEGGLVLDFQKKVEVFGYNGAKLVDCSTADYFCARGRIVDLVLPRRCSDIGTRVGKLSSVYPSTGDQGYAQFDILTLDNFGKCDADK
jgi:hypothetical protein